MKLLPTLTAITLANALLIIIMISAQSLLRTSTTPSHLESNTITGSENASASAVTGGQATQVVGLQASPTPTARTTNIPSQATAQPVTTTTQKPVSPTPTPLPTTTPTVVSTPTPTPQPGCLVVIDGTSYDLAAFRSLHSGGDIFQCGTDMSAIFHNQHSSGYLQRLAPYKI